MASRQRPVIVVGKDSYGDLRKALFQSPETSDSTKTLMCKLQIEHDVETSLRSLQKDIHEQRIKQLRDLQKQITEDNWKYSPIEKLLGLQ